MRFVLMIVFVSLALPMIHGAEHSPNTYVGLKYTDPPAGIKNESGWLVSRGSTEFAVDEMVKDGVTMLWLVRIVHVDAPRINEVLDVLVEPALKKGESRVAGCRERPSEDQAPDLSLLAIVKEANAEWLPAAGHAWKIDLEKKKFVPISPDGVECLDESYGL